MKYLSKFREFYHSNYPTYLVTIALLAALVVMLLQPQTPEEILDSAPRTIESASLFP